MTPSPGAVSLAEQKLRVPPTSEGVARFWSKVEKTAGCWFWRGAIHKLGYGQCVIGSRRVVGERTCAMAHRVAYELCVGPIPDGLEIDHLCRVRNCVNPAHLETVTRAENNRRAGLVITHCPRGHEYTPENTRVRACGRCCRTCERMLARVRKDRALSLHRRTEPTQGGA